LLKSQSKLLRKLQLYRKRKLHARFIGPAVPRPPESLNESLNRRDKSDVRRPPQSLALAPGLGATKPTTGPHPAQSASAQPARFRHRQVGLDPQASSESRREVALDRKSTRLNSSHVAI